MLLEGSPLDSGVPQGVPCFPAGETESREGKPWICNQKAGELQIWDLDPVLPWNPTFSHNSSLSHL